MAHEQDAQSHALVPHGGTQELHDLRMGGQSGLSESSVINGATGQPLVAFPEEGSGGQIVVAEGQVP